MKKRRFRQSKKLMNIEPPHTPPKSGKPMSPTSSGMRRGRPIKYPRPPDCPHTDRPEHANGVCYQCSSNINNQKKREKKMREEQGTFAPVGKRRDADELPGNPKGRKKRRNNGSTNYPEYFHDPGFIEINVGGKIFATTLQTISREMSLLSALVNINNGAKYDSKGRVFVDRDPTHFRWILNFLRDGYLITTPQQPHERLELLQEARYYQLPGLIALLEGNERYLPTPGTPSEQTDKGPPTFLVARPSTKGTFFLQESKWANLFPNSPGARYLHLIGVQFLDGRDEVVFCSLELDTTRNLTQTQELCHSKLEIKENAKAPIILEVDGENLSLTAEAEFWWEPSCTQYPQLCGKFYTSEQSQSGPLDFFRSSN